MKTFLVLICTVALACAAGGAQEKNKSKKHAPRKTQAQSTQHAAAAGGGPQKAKGSQHGTKIGGPPVSSGGQKTKGKTAHNASGSYSARAETTAGYQKKKRRKGKRRDHRSLRHTSDRALITMCRRQKNRRGPRPLLPDFSRPIRRTRSSTSIFRPNRSR